MTDIAQEVLSVPIEDELKKSYLDYAMSVIVARALPDARDGLKPVHRRVLFAMNELSNEWNKPYKKSARVVGDVLGKYHPHSDTSVYDALVRMVQPFAMRYPLIDGQGNFGSIDGDSPAAMRYTEIRMARLAHFLLLDLEKETVDFSPNYDESEEEPIVLPARLPNLLLNGSSGIAVGMATNIPPHNLSEVIEGCVALIQNPELTVEQLMEYIQGPDFPTAATISGRGGILDAYRTGRGRVVMRAKAHVEEEGHKTTILITELPYQVNKAVLIEKIADLVKEKKIEGISGLRDESDKDGLRIVIEVRRGENAEVILNNLYVHTALQTSFGVNMVALDRGQPKLMTLKGLLTSFIEHRREVITRRTAYELKKAREKAHLLEGLGIALANIDAMISLIKAAKSPAEAKVQLTGQLWEPGLVLRMLEKTVGAAPGTSPAPLIEGLQAEGYRLSALQAQAILDLKLHRLTGLEQEKLFAEYEALLREIQTLYDILLNPEHLTAVMIQELKEIQEKFGDARRTEITEAVGDLSVEDLIADETFVVTLSHEGYIKSQPIDVYQAQRRGGKGKLAATVKEEDFIERLIVANTHDFLLCFSNRGKCYWLKVYQVPQAARQAKGKPIINLVSLEADEEITEVLPVRHFADSRFILMTTSQGVIKKVPLEQFSHPRLHGLIAIALDPEDRLIGADITEGTQEVMLFTTDGKAIRFHESEVRTVGRAARGVRGIKLKPGQKVVSVLVIEGNPLILTITENGFGKRTPLADYRVTARAGQGVTSILVSPRNGPAIGALQVEQTDEILLISSRGTLVRLRVSEIRKSGRNTQGVKLIAVNPDEKVIAMTKILEVDRE